MMKHERMLLLITAKLLRMVIVHGGNFPSATQVEILTDLIHATQGTKPSVLEQIRREVEGLTDKQVRAATKKIQARKKSRRGK